jgi:hypothetical protein
MSVLPIPAETRDLRLFMLLLWRRNARSGADCELSDTLAASVTIEKWDAALSNNATHHEFSACHKLHQLHYRLANFHFSA